MIKKLILLLSFIAVFTAGFMVGIYTLPILTATPAPAITTLQQHANRTLSIILLL